MTDGVKNKNIVERGDFVVPIFFSYSLNEYEEYVGALLSYSSRSILVIAVAAVIMHHQLQ